MDHRIEAARAAFIKAAEETQVSEVGIFIHNDGDGEYTIDGAFNLDKALQAALNAASFGNDNNKP